MPPEGPRPGERPPGPDGWCCQNREVFPCREGESREPEARFFRVREEAEEFCRLEHPRPPFVRPGEEGRRPEHSPQTQPLPEQDRGPGPPPGNFAAMGCVDSSAARLAQYRFRLELGIGVTYEGLLVRGSERRYYRVSSNPAESPKAEVFWSGEGGVGHKLDTNTWFRLVKRPPMDYLGFALQLLRQAPIESVREEGRDWVVTFAPWKGDSPEDPLYRMKHSPDEFFDQFVAKYLCCGEEREKRQKFVMAVRKLEASAMLRISRDDCLIRELRLGSPVPGMRPVLRAEFGPSQESIPTPRVTKQALNRVEIPEGLLLFTMPSLGGWMDIKNHSPWTQRALDLIAKTDTKKQYLELTGNRRLWAGPFNSFTEALARDTTKGDNQKLDFQKHHPAVIGAYYEDETGPMPQYFKDCFDSDTYYTGNNTYYFPAAGLMRDCHHYGYKSAGLHYEWYFKLRGTPPDTTQDGDCYYSARDWGYGNGRIKEDLNRMTFTEAIKQFYRYDEEGKRNAILMLGFVTHLLMDSGHPDHAAIVCHPASGYNAKEILVGKGICTALSVEVLAEVLAGCFMTHPWPWNLICPIEAAYAMGVAYGICADLADPNKVGYERLVGDKWDLSRVQSVIDSTGPLFHKDYDAYFKDLGDFSLAEMAKFPQFTHALGCESLTVPVIVYPLTIPNMKPVIDVNNSSETKPYLDFTDAIVPRIISTSAGFMEHFYQIVNYPPFLERMAIVQWEPGNTPTKFAFFKDNTDECVRYDYEWTMGGTQENLTRTLTTNVKAQKLTADRPAYVFLLFGPSTIGPFKGSKPMEKVVLKVMPKYPTAGVSSVETVTLNAAQDEDLGTYYWGSFKPKNCGQDSYLLTFEVVAQDGAPHLEARSASGEEIDSKPATVAMVDSTDAPKYPFTGYEPGADTNHEIWVAPFVWQKNIKSTSQTITLSKTEEKVEYALQIDQKTWTCNWEEKFCRPNCEVSWSLQPNVKFTWGSRTITTTPEDLRLKVELDNEGNGKVKVIVKTGPKNCEPGTYEIDIDYSIAMSPTAKTGTVTLTLQVQ